MPLRNPRGRALDGRFPSRRRAPSPSPGQGRSRLPPAPHPWAGCRRWAHRERTKSCRKPSPPTLATPKRSTNPRRTTRPKGRTNGVSDFNRHIWQEKSDTPGRGEGGASGSWRRSPGGSTGWSRNDSCQERGSGGEQSSGGWRSGASTHCNRGAYAVGHDLVSQRGRWRAATLACDEAALLSHRSAAALWGLERGGASPIDVTSPRGNQGRVRLPGVSSTAAASAATRNGPAATASRSPRSPAPSSTSPKSSTRPRLQRAFEEADRLHLLRLRELEQVIAWGGDATPSSRSGESWPSCAPPSGPARPSRIASPPSAGTIACPRREPTSRSSATRSTRFWPAAKLVVEADSFEFHGHRAAFERDRARDAAMQAAGYRVIRLTHRRLEGDAGGGLPRSCRELLA